MRVRFLKDTVYETEGFEKGPRFEAGSVHEFREDIAERWIRRGLAERVANEAPPRTPRRAAEPSPPSPPPPSATTAPPAEPNVL